METILFYTTITLLVAVIAINLVLPLCFQYRIAAMAEQSRFAAVKRLYGLHYQRKAFLICDKR